MPVTRQIAKKKHPLWGVFWLPLVDELGMSRPLAIDTKQKCLTYEIRRDTYTDYAPIGIS